MAESVIQGDIFVNGNLRSVTGQVPAASITNASVVAGAGLDDAKLKHRYRAPFAQPNTTATSETRTIYRATAAGSVLDFVAGSIAANGGAATVTVDLRKNGTTILSAVVTLDNANAARVGESGTISTPAYVAGDEFEVVTVATAGGGTLATGVFAFATFSESPS